MIDKNILYLVLKARENREKKRKKITEKYNLPVITVSLNIPGPKKDKADYEPLFEVLWNILSEELSKFNIIYSEKEKTLLGYGGYMAVKADEKELKLISLEIEKSHPSGQLFDIDVTDKDGERVSREIFDFPPRLCIVCNKKPAFVCIGERNHSLEETLEVVDRMAADGRRA